MKFKPPQELIDNGYIRVQESPDGALRLYDYSQSCQFEKNWNEWTLASRGIVVDADDNIVARPFKKFFNWEELIAAGTAPAWPPEQIFDKLDGSLGIIYWWNGDWRMNTRGSFQSEQAIKGLEMLRHALRDQDFAEGLRRDCTHLVEIIYPTNRIVVDYGGLEALVYLGSVVNETGENLWVDEMEIFHLPMEYRAERLEQLYDEKQQDREGYVLKWPDGTRAKIKFEEYKRLHRIITGVNERAIWEMLSEGKELNELLDKVPDEFFAWVEKTASGLRDQFNKIAREADEAYAEIMSGIMHLHEAEPDEKARKKIVAMAVKDHPMAPLLFQLHARKSIGWNVWRMIRPAANKPYKVEV